jgi:hypothetical protein
MRMSSAENAYVAKDAFLEESLRMVYFRYTPLPPEVVQQDLARLSRIAIQNPDEFAKLQKLYQGKKRYMALATRDSDQDGILDYSISVREGDEWYFGKFRENDLDVDGDHIDNLYDSSPYDPNMGGTDSNENRIPDRGGVDYMHPGLLLSVSAMAAKLQQKFFKAYKVALIEKDLRFSPSQLSALEDAFAKVFGSALRGGSGGSSYFRAVTAEKYVFADPDLNDGTYAAVLENNQTLILFGNASELEPMLQLGLIVHELAHGLHFLEDMEDRDSASAKKEMIGTSGFLRRMELEYEWSLRQMQLKSWNTYKPTWREGLEGLRMSYRGVPVETWAEKLQEVPACEDPEEIESSMNQIAALAKSVVVGSYALSDPYEFYADGFMGYVFLSIENFLIKKRLIPADMQAAWRLKLRVAINQEWPCFFYWNIGGTKLWDEFEDKVPLSGEYLDLLARRYFSKVLHKL